MTRGEGGNWRQNWNPEGRGEGPGVTFRMIKVCLEALPKATIFFMTPTLFTLILIN